MGDVYCNFCNKHVSYQVSPTEHFGKLDGIYYLYKGLDAKCSECGKKLNVPEVREYNLNELHKAKEGKVNIYV